MKLINPSVEIIPQEEGLLGVYKQIEIAGRTCYKSEDKITEDSCKEFVQRMINSGHTAMLEHGTVYMCVPVEEWREDQHEWEYMFPESLPWVSIDCDGVFYLITTNFRHIIEGGVGVELISKYICEPVNGHAKRVTVRFTCDRGVSHELVRHRVFSFAQESTRYCNYSKDKFGNELTFIIPYWADLKEEGYYGTDPITKIPHFIVGPSGPKNFGFNAMNPDLTPEQWFILSCCDAQDFYFNMLNIGGTPQQARQMLTNALKTEVVMTGFVNDWEHFFELRCAPNAHPDMQVLAKELKNKFIESGLL